MNDYISRKCCHKNSMSMMNNNMNIDMMDDFCDEDTNIVTTAQSDCANLCTMPQNNCDCGFDMDTESVFPDNPMLAQSYVPIQKMNKVFTPDVGLKMGTIFPELVSPYMPCQSIREIEYIRNNNSLGEGCNK